jgi:hypothetical protein
VVLRKREGGKEQEVREEWKESDSEILPGGVGCGWPLFPPAGAKTQGMGNQESLQLPRIGELAPGTEIEIQISNKSED